MFDRYGFFERLPAWIAAGAFAALVGLLLERTWRGESVWLFGMKFGGGGADVSELAGLYLLSDRPCARDRFEDVTGRFEGRYIRIADVAAGPSVGGDDGAHRHAIVAETEPIPLGEGGDRGRATQPAAAGARLSVTGVAGPDGSDHEHAYIGLRLCRVRLAMPNR